MKLRCDVRRYSHWWLDRCFLYAGRIAEAKGISHILKAWLQLASELMEALGIPPAEIERDLRLFRDHDERQLAQTHAIYLDEQQLIQSAQQAAREYGPVAPGMGGVEQYEVEVAGEAAVLEAVVEQKNIGLRLVFEDKQPAGDAIGLGVDGDVLLVEQFAEEGLFIAHAACAAVIAAHEDGGMEAVLFEFSRQPADEGGFTGAAGGDVADGDDGNGQVMRREDLGVVESVADGSGNEIWEFGDA